MCLVCAGHFVCRYCLVVSYCYRHETKNIQYGPAWLLAGEKKKTKKKLSGFCRANQHLIYLENCFSQSIPQVCVYLSGPCIKSNVSLPLATNSLPFPPTRTPFSSYSFSFFFLLLPASSSRDWAVALTNQTHTHKRILHLTSPMIAKCSRKFFRREKETRTNRPPHDFSYSPSRISREQSNRNRTTHLSS